MKYCAVIIDDRPSERLDEIISEHAKFLSEDWEIKHISNVPIKSLTDYNRLLISRDFWESMPEKVLIFQHDSLLLREGIEEFLEYDYIGAPISDTNCFNGGLSLRDTKMMLNVIDKIPYNGMHEDMYFSYGTRELGGKLPSVEEAKLFSVETMFSLGSLGYHAIEKHLPQHQCELIKNQYKNG